MANTITVIDSSGGKKEVSDTPENVQIAKDNGFKVERGILGQVADFAAGHYEDSIEGRILRKGLEAVGIAPPPAAPKDHTGKITVVDSSGGRREVTDSEDNRKLAADHGFKVESLTETKAGDILAQPEYQGARGAGHVFGAKRASEFLFGVPEIARKASMTDEEKLAYEKLLSDNSTASVAGTGLGIAGNMVTPGLNLGGAATKAGRAATLGLEKLGVELVEKAAVEGTAEATIQGTSFLGKMAVGATKHAAGAAVYSAPRAAAEAVFEDPTKAGEGMAINIGLGAVLGGVSPILGKIPDALRGAAVDSGFTAEQRFMKMIGTQKGTLKKIGEEDANSIARIMIDAGANEGSGMMSKQKLVENIEAIQQRSGEKIGEIGQQLDAEIASQVKEANLARKVLPSINPDAGLEKSVGRGEKIFGNSIHANPDPGGSLLTPLEDAGGNLPPVIGKFGGVADHLDGKVSLFNSVAPIESEAAPLFDRRLGLTAKAAANDATDRGTKAIGLTKEAAATVPIAQAGFSVGNVVDAIDSKVMPEIEGSFSRANAARNNHLKEIIQDVVELGYGKEAAAGIETVQDAKQVLQGLPPLTFKQAGVIKKEMGNLAALKKNFGLTEKEEVARDVYRIVSNELTDSVERAATLSGKPGLLAEYQLAKQQYRATKMIEDHNLLENMMATAHGNRLVGLTDHIMGGHAIGAAMAGHPGALAIPVAKKMIESTPAQSFMVKILDGMSMNTRAVTAESIASRLESLDSLAGKANELQSKTIHLDKSAPNPMAAAVGSNETDPQKAYKAFRDTVSPLATDPAKLMAKFAPMHNAIAETGDTDAAFSYMQHQIAVVNYLHQQMPKPPPNPSLFLNREYVPSAAELSRFADQCQAAQDPFHLIRKIENGQLNKTQLDTVKVLFPGISTMIAERIKQMGYQKQIEDKQPNLPYNVRYRMQQLSGALGDPSMSPEKAAALQANFKKKAAAEEQPSAAAGKAFGKNSSALATAPQRLGLK